MNEGSSKGSVRFADERAPSPRPTPAAALPPRLEVRLGFVLQGGIYITDLLCLEGTAAEAQPAAPAAQPAAAAAAAPPQPEVRGLDAANLSISVECGATGQPPRVALRLWADREGPFDATFSLVLPPEGQEVEVHVTATVFSRKKGHPALKPHVRCVGFAADTDTEAASDWQGFE